MPVDLKKFSVVQQITTVLAVVLLLSYGKTRNFSLFIPGMVLGILAVLLWLGRRIYEGDLYKKAMHLAEKGEHLEALSLLARAEEAWSINEAHCTPKTMTRDFRRLAVIVAAAQEQALELGRGLDTEELSTVIAVYVGVYSNRKSFIFGTHSLKAGAAAEIRSVSQKLPVLRGRFRATCQEYCKSLVSRP